MKALVISPQPFFSPRGTPFSIYYRTLIMSELGVKIDLLTYGEGQDVEIPGLRIIRIRRFAFLGNVKIGPSFLKLFLDMFIFLKTVRLLLFNRYQFVHAHEEAVFIAYFLKPIFRFKLIYDMHSSLPQQLDSSQFTSAKWLISLFERLEDAVLRNADVIITICEDLYRLVQQKMPNKTAYILIENSIFDPVRLSANSENEHPIPSNGILQDIPSHKKLVVYAGTLESYQGINMVIEAFKEVLRDYPNAFLVVVGGRTEQVANCRYLAANLNIASHCLFTGMVAKNIARQYIEKADVLLSPRISGNNTPLKIYELIASGKPLVATNIRSHTQVLDGEVAFLVEPDPGGMARGIREALSADKQASEKAKNAQKLYQRKYSREIYTQKIKQVLEFLK
jgi:glycosyltransferase involved in cell wall biosynthesis